MCIFSEYLQEKGMNVSFEQLPVQELPGTLREFYASIITRDGKHYSETLI